MSVTQRLRNPGIKTKQVPLALKSKEPIFSVDYQVWIKVFPEQLVTWCGESGGGGGCGSGGGGGDVRVYTHMCLCLLVFTWGYCHFELIAFHTLHV